MYRRLLYCRFPYHFEVHPHPGLDADEGVPGKNRRPKGQIETGIYKVRILRTSIYIYTYTYLHV
jgi:hypothetical protein